MKGVTRRLDRIEGIWMEGSVHGYHIPDPKKSIFSFIQRPSSPITYRKTHVGFSVWLAISESTYPLFSHAYLSILRLGSGRASQSRDEARMKSDAIPN